MTAALVIFGLIMVLSASAIVSIDKTSSAYTIFVSQAVFAAIGGVALVVASRMPVRGWKRLALPILVGRRSVLQLLVLTPIGRQRQRQPELAAVRPVNVQPSELTKVGLVLAGGLGPRRQAQERSTTWRHVVVPYLVPVAAATHRRGRARR